MALHDLWIFQSTVPGPLAADQDAVKSQAGAPPNPFVFSLSALSRRTGRPRAAPCSLPTARTSRPRPPSPRCSSRIRPGGMREMHWHPKRRRVAVTTSRARGGDRPRAESGVRPTSPPATSATSSAATASYVKNTGDTDLVFLEVFNARSYQSVLLVRLARPHAARHGRRPLQHVAPGRRPHPEQHPGRGAGLKDCPAAAVVVHFHFAVRPRVRRVGAWKSSGLLRTQATKRASSGSSRSAAGSARCRAISASV